MTVTLAFTKKVSREQRIPFDVSVNPFYGELNLAAIDEAAGQIKQGKVKVLTLENLEAPRRLEQAD